MDSQRFTSQFTRELYLGLLTILGASVFAVLGEIINIWMYIKEKRHDRRPR